jgi:choline dehydrogenase
LPRTVATTRSSTSSAFEAAVQAGHAPTDDSNGATATGTSWHESNVVNGERQSAADGYLVPVAGRANLTIVADAHVRRLRVKHARCEGVEYLKDGKIHTSSADREVILSAGTIGTPQLLLLSGIGAGPHLRDLGIDVVADMPGVGANLQDHPKSQIAYTTTHPVGNGVHARKPQVLMRSASTEMPDVHAIFLDFPIHPRFAIGEEHGYSDIFALMNPSSSASKFVC